MPCLLSSLFSCPAYSLCFERSTGPPGLPCIHYVKHAMVSDPGEAGITLPLTVMPVLTSTFITVLSFPTRQFHGSIPSTLRLTAYLLLKILCYHRASKDSLPGGWPTFRAGFTPAEIHDLARPQNRSVPFLRFSPDVPACSTRLLLIWEEHKA